VTVYFDKISGVINQVDEIDSKYYQFEGGLTLTGKHQKYGLKRSNYFINEIFFSVNCRGNLQIERGS